MPLKRIFDVVFSVAVLVLSLPLLIFLTISVAVSTRSNPFFWQSRVGRGGRLFYCFKFRTMRPDAEDQLKVLLDQDPLLNEEWKRTRKLKNDPRITRLGAFLRRTSLDELPQFVNVLKGDLSVVGPRAVVMDELETHFRERAKEILRVRPGLTGLWQVSGRSDTTYQRRIRLDETYIQEQNLLMDLKIVAKTIPVMFNSKGAY